MKRYTHGSVFLVAFIFAATAAHAQTENLLKNADAGEGARHWQPFGRATVEELNGEIGFVLRDGGYFIQDVPLPEGSAGMYAVFIGRGAGDRAATARPGLYGYMMNAGDPRGGRIMAYLQGQGMSGAAGAPGEWVKLWGIFRVPIGTGRVRFFLQQSRRRGDVPDGAAARFRELGLYLFPSEEEARSFVGGEAAGKVLPADARGTPGVTKCALTPAEVPEIYGVKLGMSLEQLAAAFPGLESEKNFSEALRRARTQGEGRASVVVINPALYLTASGAEAVGSIGVRVFEGRVFNIHVDYAGPPRWNSVDDFIAAYAGTLNLPPPGAWASVNHIPAKYAVCDGLEITFYALPTRAYDPGKAHNPDSIRLTDTAAEKRSVPNLPESKSPEQ